MESGEGVAVVTVGGAARDPPADNDVAPGGDDGMELILFNTTQSGPTQQLPELMDLSVIA